ncbi:MAG: PDZ domain-containing protein [Pseudomonadota bacterium]|nr:MAG: PDZ domain-containing protein [Pseudomonadota bacterium]
MLKKSAVFFCTIVIILFCGGTAKADPSQCPTPSLNHMLSSYDQIFQAEVQEVKSRPLQSYIPVLFDGPDFIMTLKIVERYKGKSAIPETFYYYGRHDHSDRRHFVKNRSYVFFLHNKDISEQVINLCTPVRPLLANNEATTKTVERLREYVQKTRAREGLLLYQEKLLVNRYESDLRAVQEILQFTVGKERRAEKLQPYQNTEKCDGIYSVTADMPYFLKEFPDLPEKGLYLSERQEVSEYGTSLYKLGRYREALRPLCLTKDLAPVNAFQLAIATYRTYPNQFLSFEKIAAKNITLTDENLDGTTLRMIDLSNAEMDTVAMVGANFSEALFTKARLKNINAEKANFEKANFVEAWVSGNLRKVNFAQANLRHADFSQADISHANFQGADIRGVDFGADPEKMKEINLDQAIFDDTTLWPVGVSPQMQNIVYKAYSTNDLTDREENKYSIKHDTSEELYTTDQKEQYFPAQGRLVLDGSANHRLRKATLNNNQFNLIELHQGAFRNGLKRHDVSVAGDENLDVVRLDGCLAWETAKRQGRYFEHSKSVTSFWYYVTKERPLIEYTTSPASGNPLKAYLQKGLKISFTETCKQEEPSGLDAPVAMDEGKGTQTQEKLSGDLKALQAKIRSLEKKWAAKRRHTPDFIPSPPWPSGTKDCPQGDLVFAEAGRYTLDIPKGCRRILVKAWGAGGGGRKGGTGGFTMGIVDIPENAAVDVIVGGAGGAAKPRKLEAPGGFNGGGAGGDGRPGGTQALMAGGGGRSEVLVNDTVALIAGGGGGGAELYGYPGGGRVPAELNTHLARELDDQIPKNSPNRSGGFGRGGQAAIDETLPENCLPPENGGEKSGGSGASGGDKCPFFAGSGGGAGYGGGSGGAHMRPGSNRAGGGGGGLAPEYGITVWGGFQFHVPPNRLDLQYISQAGSANNDGMIAVVWPAPDPESFLRYAVSSMRVRDNGTRKKIWQVSHSASEINGQTSQKIKNYAPNDAVNIEFYEKFDISHFSEYSAPELSESLKSLISLMKAGKLPTEFPHFIDAERYRNIAQDGFALDKLDLNGNKFYPVMHGNFGCSVFQSKDRPNTLFAPKENNFSRLDCSRGVTNIFLFAGMENSLKSQGGTNLIFISNGNTTLELPSSQDILIFDKGFGDTTIKKACLLSPFRNAPLYATPPIRIFGGTGMVFRAGEKGQQYPVVLQVIKDKPAAHAGLMAGDEIVAVNGLATIGKSAQEVRSMIVGPPGEKVEFTLIREKLASPRVVTLTREEITLAPDRRDLKEIDYRYPYEWPDFIVFGKGISPEDMEWRGSALVHREAGHSITFSEGPCFNFVFTEEGEFALPSDDASD